MKLVDWYVWLTWAPLLPIAGLVAWHASRHFHGFDWGITLSLGHRARYRQQPGRDYPSTVPALYVALYQWVGPWARSWDRLRMLRIAFLCIAYALLACGVPGLSPPETVLIASAGALCLSGIYQLVWYSELAHLHIIAIALWSRHLPGSPLEATAFGAAAALLAFQRPNVAWVFGVALAMGMALSWPGTDLAWAVAGAGAAMAALHALQPYYALASLRRYFALGGRARESFFFTPGLDVVTALRWLLVYIALAGMAIWLSVAHALAGWPPMDRVVGAGMAVAAFFGLKLSKDSKEPDQFLLALGLYWIALSTPYGQDVVPAWALLFAGLGASALVAIARAERTRLQTFVPLSRVPSGQLNQLESLALGAGLGPEVLGSTHLGRDRYASWGEELVALEHGPLRGLRCGTRMRETLQDFDDGLAGLGAGRIYALGPDIEWLAFARGLPPAPHTPPAWHNGNMYLADDAAAALAYFRRAPDLVFVFTCKDRLRWMEYNYDWRILQFFETELFLVHQTRWLLFFARKDPSAS
jgi:hypothetical protein